MLYLKNPHSVLAALKHRPKDVVEIILPPKAITPAWELVKQKAAQLRIPVKSHGGVRSAKDFKDRESESLRMSGAEALVKERSPVLLEEVFKNQSSSKEYGLWLALDHIQDPHNVGAIFRAAAFFGVNGLLMTQERSAPLTSIVYDVATGGVESVPFCIQANLRQSLEKAKDSGLWILGTSEHASDSLFNIPKDRNWLLVFGNEEKGVRRLTEESCDVLCRIVGTGDVQSLNVSVAAGICISHLSS
jgi:23S rRNA (guanosine2251-2'-O)-methyltransferase